RIKGYSAEEKIAAFLDGIRRAEEDGHDVGEALYSLASRRQEALQELARGSIKGRVHLAGGQAVREPVSVLTFDEYGFFAGMTSLDLITSSYSIPGLATGDYFLVARSSSSHQFLTVNSQSWKKSSGGQLVSRVAVQNGVEVQAPDFFLAEDFDTAAKSAPATVGASVGDASISGNVSGPSGALNFAFVFALHVETGTIRGLSFSLFGEYTVENLDAGTYKAYADSYFELSILLVFGGFPVQVNTESLIGEYYENAATAAAATPITLAESEARTGVNFSLELGGGISGNITDAAGTALDSVFVLAIPALDFTNLPMYLTDSVDLGLTVADAQGHYELKGLSPGAYFVRTLSLLNTNFAALFEGAFFGKHAPRVLDEYYGDVQSLFAIHDASPVPVVGTLTTTDIDFELALAGGISGSFSDVQAGGAPVEGVGSVVVFNALTGYPELAFDFDPDDATYEARPLPNGDFKLLGTVSSETLIYLPQFYNGKPNLDLGDPVTVTTPNTTPDKDFAMIRAGLIHGTVSFPAAKVSSVTEPEISVLAFDASSGVLVGSTTADSLTRGYVIPVPGGSYKVAALVGAPGVATTYHGGGTSFDDGSSTAVSVTFGGDVLADVTLAVGNGVISGSVLNTEGLPVPGVLVIAYNGSHTVSAGVSGFDLVTGEPFQNPAEYRIQGLVSGDYSVRTFSFFQILGLAESFGEGGGDEGGDPLTAILGLFGNPEIVGALGLQFFADQWYENVNIDVDLEQFDLIGFGVGLLFGGADPQGIVPFFSPAPSGVMSVSVDSPGERSGVNFTLQVIDLGDLLTSVDDPLSEPLPTDFELSQNFPNPFNPSTVINYTVPQTAPIRLRVYNVLGQKIRTLLDGVKERGTHTIQWDGLNDSGQQVAVGIYFFRLETDDLTLSRKMLLVK
ncbi:T9SS type A sorting domain-containing protein, partial [bacterium]|nr:T9SS type A sorting domain-containing protein [bacterium]